MYEAQPFVLSAEQVEAVGQLSRQIDLAPGPGGSRITPFPDRAALAAILACGGWWPSAWCQAAFVALYPSAQLVGHCDPPIPGARYHLPIVLNADCWVFHAGAWQQLAIGRAYQMDPTQPHGAVNWGATTRVHLILDTQE